MATASCSEGVRKPSYRGQRVRGRESQAKGYSPWYSKAPRLGSLSRGDSRKRGPRGRSHRSELEEMGLSKGEAGCPQAKQQRNDAD
jgi:hypothetical protein